MKEQELTYWANFIVNLPWI